MESKLKGTLKKGNLTATCNKPTVDTKLSNFFKKPAVLEDQKIVSSRVLSSAENNSAESTNVFENHIRFAQNVIQKYNWDSNKKNELVSKLESIKRKHDDKCLNLCIVGEFSTGKSTFINAMLRKEDFLVSSSLQGTTVSGTIIEDSNDFRITLVYDDGESDTFVYENIEDLNNALVTFTTNSQIAKSLAVVRIGIPGTPLAKGFRIIDTPGTNSNELWHEEVTLHTVQEYADMLILILDGTKPFAQTFCDFVKNNLASTLGQAIFVVTRYDMIRKREREGVMNFLETKVCDEFSLENPLILPYSSLDIFKSCSPDPQKSDLALLSEQSENRILSHMSKKKEDAQKSKLLSFMYEMYDCLRCHLSEISEGYRDELDMLLRSRALDLDSFVKKEKTLRSDSFYKRVSSSGNEIISYIDESTEKAWLEVVRMINGFSQTSMIKDFISDFLPSVCCNIAQKIVVGAKKKSMVIYRWFEEEVMNFQYDFEQLFDDLELLKVSFGNIKISHPDSSSIMPQCINELSSYARRIKSREDVEIAKQKAISMLHEPIYAYFSDITGLIKKSYHENVLKIKSCIFSEIDRYLVTYKGAVNEKISLEQEKIRAVENKISQVKNDMVFVENNSKYLADIVL